MDSVCIRLTTNFRRYKFNFILNTDVTIYKDLIISTSSAVWEF